jgi:serine O-acetyltransferase
MKALFKGLKRDIAAFKARDPAARSSLEVLLLYSGLHALMMHRPAHWCYNRGWFFLARLISQIGRFFTLIEIHPGAKIGRGVVIDHGAGVVIGETAEVGDDCTLYQGVTLGGTGTERGKRHPTLERGVLVGAGAKVLGPFTVGEGSRIAAGSVVLRELPPYSTAVGAPARVVRIAGERVDTDAIDHVHIPDPVAAELESLRQAIARLETRLSERGL